MTLLADQRHEGQAPNPTARSWLSVLPLPKEKRFWENPYITASPVDAWGRVNAGDVVTLTAWIQNDGLDTAIGVRAHFYEAEPSGSPPPPGRHIAGSVPVSIPSKQVAPLSCQWIPKAVNGTHQCLIVEAFTWQDPVEYTFRAALDRHVGQRNVGVRGPEAEPQTMQLALPNPFGHHAPTTLHVVTTQLFGADRLPGAGLAVQPIDALLHFDDRAFAGPLAALGVTSRTTVPGRDLRVGEVIDTNRRSGKVDEEETQRLLLAQRDDYRDFGREIARLDLPPYAVAQVELTSDPSGADSEALIHQLTQVTDGVAVGGYTLVSPPGEA